MIVKRKLRKYASGHSDAQNAMQMLIIEKRRYQMEQRITYSNLSGWLKFAAIMGWAVAIYLGLAFLVGFIWGVTGAY